MKKRIITVSRQCGSGGHTIASLLAQQLGVPLYDKKILKIVAQRAVRRNNRAAGRVCTDQSALLNSHEYISRVQPDR